MNVIASKPIGIALFDATDLCVFVAIARFRLLVNFEVLDFMCDIVGIMILNCLCDKVSPARVYLLQVQQRRVCRR